MRLIRSWTTGSQVERVDIYTRQSLFVLMWGFAAVAVAGAEPEIRADPVAGGALVAGALVVTAAATTCLHAVAALHPAVGPIPWGTVGPFVGLVALAALGVLLLPDGLQAAGALSLLSATAWGLGGLRDRRVLLLLMAGLTALPLLGAVEWYSAGYGLTAGTIVVFTVRTSLWLIDVVRDLDRGREARAALAVAEERLRFSRDLHDVLGRRLSAIAVKSELAATLADRSDPGAAAQMLEVREVAHEAMREARELVRGYRPTDLTQELDGARSLLESAGITVELDVTGLPGPWHEPAAWVVREAVTNVLRHSAATWVAIKHAGSELSVVNDGVIGASSPKGSGLAGLRERLAPLGADLRVVRAASTFSVLATLPGSGPVEAAT